MFVVKTLLFHMTSMSQKLQEVLLKNKKKKTLQHVLI